MNEMFSSLFFFSVTTGLTCLIPGVTAMAVATNGATYGQKSVLSTICGIVFANIIFFILVGLGAKAFLDKAPIIYKALQFIGVSYMLYLGVSFIKSRNYNSFSLKSESINNGISTIIVSSFKQGFYIQASNPKAFLYFLALLPQFIDPMKPLGVQLIIFCAITALLDLLAYSFYGYLGTVIKKYELTKLIYYLKVLTGIMLIILVIKFLLN
ncbi:MULTISPECIES: LysE family translocator [Acinetobacter calcoaceticus/baumannii complex]|uniref:LysE family translocator n=1 Tax=Acinetobacter calcoaceticus/baumannii complex TaxID=909768 RepID=UPI0011A9F0D9|nr:MULTISPECIES: LysE family translocator [Acinetobacter calcoaceticus/baumannii complex]MBD0476734.1 LysE family translocator [Acinetobacter baumannii]MCP9174357.1 LysE family translocator [Acinetobacter baumannii]MCZ2937053.1 LysE family translocator [Acinetobacter baumannii]MDQ8923217.1 LysE family translocator [Acinetobacter baumannii]MDQ8926614.1 LysE family translocator [Acinetobacter baumannii]